MGRAVSDRVHHEPLHRAPEVVAFEIALTVGQAYLVGVCVVLAAGTGQAGLAALVLGVLGLATAVAYVLWLFGGPGTLMTLVNVPLLLLSLFALLASFQPDTLVLGGTLVRSDALGIALQLVAVAGAVLGITGGVFLPGPRRRRWHHAHHRPVAAHAPPELSTAAFLERMRTLAERARVFVGRLRSPSGAGEAPLAGRAEGTFPVAEVRGAELEDGTEAEVAGAEPAAEADDETGTAVDEADDEDGHAQYRPLPR
jgi:hypothetical protein